MRRPREIFLKVRFSKHNFYNLAVNKEKFAKHLALNQFISALGRYIYVSQPFRMYFEPKVNTDRTFN